MKRTVAFTANSNPRVLHWTARSAREAEFDALIAKIDGGLPGDIKVPAGFALALRGGIYVGAMQAFLDAAKYLEQHYAVLTGKDLDTEERKEDE